MTLRTFVDKQTAVMATSRREDNKKRKSNWTAEETYHMVHLYSEHSQLLMADFSKPGCTAKKKQEAWEEIVTQLKQKHDHGNRDVRDCQKRWQTVKSVARPRIAAYNKAITGTGGGPPPPPLSELESVIADILGSKNVSLAGCADKDEVLLYSESLSYGEAAATNCSCSGTQSLPTVSPIPPAENSTFLLVDQDDAIGLHLEKKRKLEIELLLTKIQASSAKRDYYQYKLQLLEKNELK